MTRHARTFMLPAVATLVAVLIPMLGVRVAAARHAAAGPVYGGTVRVALTGDMVTLDPAQAVSDDWLVLQGTMFNGLYGMDRNGRPQLELAAEPPTISADHKSWTFHLHRGVLFSNGTELTADDMKFTLLRVLDPHLKPAVSWGQTVDDIFQGSHAFVLGKAKDVAGIQVLDRYTIRLVLAQPVAVLPYILAESFNFVVPKAVVTHESADYFASHPIGTGPFILLSWQKGVRAVFVRNPHYFHTGKPYLDKVIVDSNVAPSVVALRVEKGEADGFGFAPEMTAADREAAQKDPTFAHYLIDAPATQVIWLNLNVHVTPLDKPAVRQAVAMAINRVHLVQLLGGHAIAATQMYNPYDSQYDPALVQKPVYPYDPRKAAALLKSSGYHGQPISVLYANDLQRNLSLAPGVLQDLQQIGLNVALRGITDASLGSIRSALTGHQIDFNGWGIDYPDGWDIYSGELACGDNGAGGGGGAHYCDVVADSLANQAEALPLGAARDALLRQAQARLLQSASRIPLVFLKPTEMVSPRVHGFYYHPIFGWQYENYWVTP